MGAYSMFPMWIGAVTCGILWELLANDNCREYLIEWLERGFPFLLAIGFIVFATLFAYNSWFKEPPNDSPTFSSQIVYRDDQNKIVPISGAKIQVGHNDAISSDVNGKFQVPLLSLPNSNTLVRISHDNYVTRFLRFDDPIISSHSLIELAHKMRIIVLEAGERGAVNLSDNQQRELTNNLENYLRATDDLELLVDTSSRNDIIKQLYLFSKGRALYDPATLQQVGNFRGATHGLFWTVIQQKGSLLVECKLVDFKTARIRATADVKIKDENSLENSLSNASAYLVDLLLVQLADIKILSPKTGIETGYQLSVEGYALYRPIQWTLYVTLLPDGNSLHYPQQQITVKDDGSWFASSVYVGNPQPVDKPLKYRVYAILIHPNHAAQIEDYLNGKNSTGLNLNALDKNTIRFLDHIEVVRVSSKSASESNDGCPR